MTDGHAAPAQRVEDLPDHLIEALSPQMRRVLEHQYADEARRRAELSLPEGPLEAARADYRAERAFWNVGGPAMASTRDVVLPVAGAEVPVRCHRPTTAARTGAPAIVFLHGGGFTLGDLDTHDRIHRMLAHHSGAVVVAVDYSLSPEAKHPQAMHETAAVAAHLAVRGEEWGIDPRRLALAGDSAGAGLSIGAALMLRDDQVGGFADGAVTGPEVFDRLRSLLLFYGGFGLADSASRRLWGGDWDGMAMEELSAFAEALYADPADADAPWARPITADLSGLPPVLVRSAALDPLADDSRAFAELLRRGGVPHDYREAPGILHSYLHFGRILDAANETLAEAGVFAAAHAAGPRR